MHITALFSRHTVHTVVLQTTTQDQHARFAFDLVYTPHMIQAIHQAVQSSASFGVLFLDQPLQK